MSITKCALAIITERGHKVVKPTWSDLDAEEESFLARHIEELRGKISEGDARGRFASGSNLLSDLQTMLAADKGAFVAIAERLVQQLATEMKTVNSSSCVVAVVVEITVGGSGRASILKLDAEIEAAQLEQTEDGIRLHVFDDLLPRPGDIQKGISWPDPRSPDSDVVVLDRVTAGSATKYFQRAFGIVASPRPKDVEDALRKDLAALPPSELSEAVAAIGTGGPVDGVIARIRETVPTFHSSVPAPVTRDAPPGYIRDTFNAAAPIRYEANGIQLLVPPRLSQQVSTRRSGTGFETVIRTSTPLTPVVEDDIGG